MWKENVVFYKDGISFTFKRNPHGQARSHKARIGEKGLKKIQGRAIEVLKLTFMLQVTMKCATCYHQ